MAPMPILKSSWSQPVLSSFLEERQEQRPLPLISLVTPAYNEAAILEASLCSLCEYMAQLEDEFNWEIIIVNDGSSDQTAQLADEFSRLVPQIKVVHHLHNGGLGQALRTGFESSNGDYIVTLDLDLSYSPEHIKALVRHMQKTGAQIVVASPYMEGGKVSNVPTFRRLLSVWANRFLSLTNRQQLSTLTGMVRAYDRQFIERLHSRSMGMEINPEILHKAKLLNASVDEIPAHLHWRTPPVEVQSPDSSSTAVKPPHRKSSMKILRHTWSIFFYGFLFRPVMFWFLPSLACLALGGYSASLAAIQSWSAYQYLAATSVTGLDPTVAIATAYHQAPHTFILSGVLLMLGVQLFSLAMLAVQSKYYFEELFYLNTSIHRTD